MGVLQALVIYAFFIVNDFEAAVGAEEMPRHRHNPETINAGRSHVHGNFVEGDMMLLTERNAAKQLWPKVGGTVSVPFVISPQLTRRIGDIQQAFNLISKKTCILFQKRTNETDYLAFVLGHGCASYVGLCGGPQKVFIGPRCQVGNICHELLHALGFYHEHTRSDREKYVTVHYENIKPGREKEFLIREHYIEDFPYDLGSIMHYGGYYFSSNGKPTIVAKNKGVIIGQRKRPSSLDIQRLRKVYNCDNEALL